MILGHKIHTLHKSINRKYKKNTLNFVKYTLWKRMKNSCDPEQNFFYVIPI